MTRPSLLQRRIANQFVVHTTIVGAAGAGLFEGADDRGRPVLISSITTDRAPAALEALYARSGGEEEAALRWMGVHQDADYQLFVIVEDRPPGAPLQQRLNVPTAPIQTARILMHLSRLAENLSQIGIFIGIHPSLIFVEEQRVRVAWRFLSLLEHRTGEFRRPLLEPTLEPPERLGSIRIPRSPATTAFSIGALGAWLATGTAPFGVTFFDELRRVPGASPPRLPAALDPILRPAFGTPAQRPSLSALNTALEALVRPAPTPPAVGPEESPLQNSTTILHFRYGLANAPDSPQGEDHLVLHPDGLLQLEQRQPKRTRRWSARCAPEVVARFKNILLQIGFPNIPPGELRPGPSFWIVEAERGAQRLSATFSTLPYRDQAPHHLLFDIGVTLCACIRNEPDYGLADSLGIAVHSVQALT